MRAGVASIDITPSVGTELSGFVVREQPSTGVHDRLFGKALFLEDESGGKLLWVHADVIGFEASFCDSVRERLSAAVGLRFNQVILSATHTHSGPPSLLLTNCGEWRPGDESRYGLAESLFEAGVRAVAETFPVELVFGFSQCPLTQDRRGFASAHVDQRCSVLGVRNLDGHYLALLANYACHPVALGAGNRQISGDLFGFAADHASRSAPGTPVVLLTNGACGNLNPPAEGVDFRTCEGYGVELGMAVLAALEIATPIDGRIRTLGKSLALSPEPMNSDAIEARACEARRLAVGWGQPALKAIETWKSSMVGLPAGSTIDLRIQAVGIGPLRIAFVGAECFSVLGDMLRDQCGERLFVVGYANGEIGYLCPSRAYDEGGYEVQSAFMYYNAPPIKRGEFELAVDQLVGLIQSLDNDIDELL